MFDRPRHVWTPKFAKWAFTFQQRVYPGTVCFRSRTLQPIPVHMHTPVLEEVSQTHSQPSAPSPVARRPTAPEKTCVSAGRRRPKRVVHVLHAQMLLTLSIFLSIS